MATSMTFVESLETRIAISPRTRRAATVLLLSRKSQLHHRGTETQRECSHSFSVRSAREEGWQWIFLFFPRFP